MITTNQRKVFEMARTSTFADKFVKAATVEAIANGEVKISRYLTIELEKLGLIKRVPVKMSEGRGRPTMTVEVTGKGRGYVALSKKWKRAA